MAIISVTSFVCGEWLAMPERRRAVFSPVSGSIIADVAVPSPDFAGMVEFARNRGGPALREMTFHDRAKMLKALAIHLNEQKERLYALNPLTGATRKDGWIDIDGGIGTVFVFASKGRREMPDSHVYLDGDVEVLSRNRTFLGQHIALPLEGVAVHINAFNFPVWGMLEKLAPTILAGMPAIVKPATSSCYLAQECFRIILESGLLPDGSVQFVAGNAEPVFEHLGIQDLVSFTGSAATAGRIHSKPSILAGATRFIAEQDSLNASVLGPDAEPGTPEFAIFISEATREITTKAGQKCTAIRRLIVPERHMGTVVDALASELSKLPVGDPQRKDVKMGSLVSVEQKADVVEKIGKIGTEADLVCGNPDAFELLGADPSVGAFLPPLLFRCNDPFSASQVHEVEAFGPVSVVMPYRGVSEAAELANRGKGSLVASVITADPGFARHMTLATGAWHGRLYFNDRTSREEATGHGSPLPHMVHGGPGRAGGGEELGGIRGVLKYMQRVAVQGSPRILTAIGSQWIPGAEEIVERDHPFKRNFDELLIGETIRTPKRTVTLADIEHFAEFTGDRFYAHMDEEAAKRNPFFPGRVAHGYLLLSFAAGLFVEPEEGPVLANTGLTLLEFQRPVIAGDEISVRLTVKRKTRRTADYGEIRWNVTIFNQNEEQVAEYELRTMNAYAARPAEDQDTPFAE